MATVTKSPTRESLPHPSEQSQPRHRNVYDCDGEYEFAIAQHWVSPSLSDGFGLHASSSSFSLAHPDA
jgi:hypothetical protein